VPLLEERKRSRRKWMASQRNESFLRQHELDQVQRVVMPRAALDDLSVPWRDSPSCAQLYREDQGRQPAAGKYSRLHRQVRDLTLLDATGVTLVDTMPRRQDSMVRKSLSNLYKTGMAQCMQ
jgi:hypothetical protein